MIGNTLHAPFESEMAFYESICSGDLELVKMLSTPLGGEGYGMLSNNPVRNIRYHLLISIALIARVCISGGMTPEESYNLSDEFIMKADEAETAEELHELHQKVLTEFTMRMGKIKYKNIYSKQIIRVIDYINCHLNDKITIQQLSEYVSLSVSYLSRLFKEEVGQNVSDYITSKKIESAKRLFNHSNQSTAEISSMLNFSSQSYFIKVFKKYTGMTPKEYKNSYNFMNRNLKASQNE